MKRKLLLWPCTFLLGIIGIIATKANGQKAKSRHLFASVNNACVVILTSATLSTSRLTTATGLGTQLFVLTIGSTVSSAYSEIGCVSTLCYRN